ncbi:MAG: hypothetical protein K1X83_00840 [Oligoflexia bacterium]|nr:hypothetical protein [Oligoflexia bacterium]
MPGTEIVGHEPQRARLKHLVQNGKIPGTLAFSGQSGVGKLPVARELTRTLLCQSAPGNPAANPYGGCNKCNSCQLFDAGNHPDFHFVNCHEKEDASVAAIREVLHRLSLRGFAGQNRVTIFNDAESLSIQAANILLKALEEPSNNTFFILVTANHSKLPATLLSRCQLWHFDNLDPAEIEKVLSRRSARGEIHLSREALHEVALLADGTLDGIDRIISDLDSWKDIKQHLDQLELGAVHEYFNFVREISKDRDRLRAKLGQIRIYSRQRMLLSDTPRAQKLWSVFLTNIIESERLIFERNLAAATVLCAAALDFIGSSGSFTGPVNGANLISKIVV